MSEVNDKFSFSAEWCEALIGHMIADKHLFLTCKANVKPEYFTGNNLGEVFSNLIKCYETYNFTPKETQIKAFVENFWAQKGLADKEAIIGRINICISRRDMYPIQFINDQLGAWFKWIHIKKAYYAVDPLLKQAKHEIAFETMKKIISEADQVNFGDDLRVRFNDLIEYTKLRLIDTGDCMTLGDPTLDGLLMDQAKWNSDVYRGIYTEHKKSYIAEGKNFSPFQFPLSATNKGGLMRGNMTVLLGPTNAGKTTTLVTIMCHNILACRRVFYMSHEQNPEELKDKMIMCLTGIPKSRWIQIEKDECAYVKTALTKAQELIERYFTYIPYEVPGAMYVENVLPIIRGEFMRCMEANGKYYDLFVNDYPGKLRSKELSRSKNNSKHDETAFVYDQIRMLDREFNCHVIVAAQTNREGYKANNNAQTRHNVGVEHIGDAFGIAQMADNVITIQRGVAESGVSVTRLMVSKSRSSVTGRIFESATNFSLSRTHGFNLGCRVVTADDLDAQAAGKGGVLSSNNLTAFLEEFDQPFFNIVKPRMTASEMAETVEVTMPPWLSSDVDTYSATVAKLRKDLEQQTKALNGNAAMKADAQVDEAKKITEERKNN